MPRNREAIERQYLRLLRLRIAQLETRISVAHSGEGNSREVDTAIEAEKFELENEDNSETGGVKAQDQTGPKANYLVPATLGDHEHVPSTGHDKAEEDDILRMEPATFCRVVHESNVKGSIYTKIEITSPELKRVYEEVAGGLSRSAKGPASGNKLELRAPFKEFVWYWKSFEEACQPVDGENKQRSQARKDLRQLMTLLQQSHLGPYLKARDKAMSGGTMPYGYLWTLFSPGATVFAKTFMDEVQMLEVHHCQTPSAGGSRWLQGDLNVRCIGIDWDGSKFSAFEYDLHIEKDNEQAEVKIDDLSVYPMEYHCDASDLLYELQKRGKKFRRLCNSDDFQYAHHGAILAGTPTQPLTSGLLSRRDPKMDQSSGTVFSKNEYAGQIIVDPHSFLKGRDDFAAGDGRPPLGEIKVHRYTACPCKVCKNSPLVQWHNQPPSSATEDYEYGLPSENDRLRWCPPRVLGFALVKKLWAQFAVSNCLEGRSEGEDRKNFFRDQLQLDDDYKKLLLAFVNNHQSSKNRNRSQKSLDIIEGKGRGLVILLHGPPGVGKTLTAETLALATGRPLLMVSTAEIGTKVTSVEANLNVYFTMAARWGAILLIDEADVFLEERIKTDNPERNMLVSAFLRGLEYYEGIIFLTTNRVRQIDRAVHSRMHLAIQYKDLTHRQKSAIYKFLLNNVDDRLIRNRESLYERIDDQLCRRNQANGRQIRNIVSSALALAKERADEEDERVQLRFEDLVRVNEVTIDFIDSLKDTVTMARARNEAETYDSDATA